MNTDSAVATTSSTGNARYWARRQSVVNMTVVKVWHVRVVVREPYMLVRMAVRFHHRTFVRVLMMLVVHVQVVVLHRLVGVRV